VSYYFKFKPFKFGISSPILVLEQQEIKIIEKRSKMKKRRSEPCSRKDERTQFFEEKMGESRPAEPGFDAVISQAAFFSFQQDDRNS
jgi:hypothetical protein